MQFSTLEMTEEYQTFAFEGYEEFLHGAYYMILRYKEQFTLADRSRMISMLSWLYYYSDYCTDGKIFHLRTLYQSTWNRVIKHTDNWSDAWSEALLNQGHYWSDEIAYFGNNKEIELYGNIIK